MLHIMQLQLEYQTKCIYIIPMASCSSTSTTSSECPESTGIDSEQVWSVPMILIILFWFLQYVLRRIAEAFLV